MKTYNQVGGWLLFLCIVLVIISPLRTIFNLFVSYSILESLLEKYPGMLMILIVDVFLSTIVMILSVRAGLLLWKIAANAVRNAKNYFLIFLGYSLIASFLPYIAGLPSSYNEAMLPETIKGIIQSLIFFGIWYSYLNVSVRVSETYEIQDTKNVNNDIVEEVVDNIISEQYSEDSNKTTTAIIKTEDTSNWYKTQTKDNKITQIVISAPVSCIRETEFDMIILPYDKFPILSTQPWCTGFVRMSGKPTPFQLVRVDEFDEEVKKSDLTIAFSFCKLAAGSIFMINTRIENETLGKRVRNKFPYLPPLVKPEAEWLVSINDSYSVEMIQDVFSSSSLNLIVANSMGIDSERMDDYGNFVADKYRGPRAHHERIVTLENKVCDLLKAELQSLLIFHKSIPSNKISFQEANQELSNILPFDKDPILTQEF